MSCCFAISRLRRNGAVLYDEDQYVAAASEDEPGAKEQQQQQQQPDTNKTVAEAEAEAEAVARIVNGYRRAHSVRALRRSALLDEGAQAWAEQLADKGALRQSLFTEGFGENLFKTTARLGVVEAVRDAHAAWYAERASFDFRRPLSNFESTGHFTQMVWKRSEEFGCGVASNETGTYVVVRYAPAGNLWTLREFSENVLPPPPVK